jgi:colanic acid/amylovoran biosynthesis glycosyltransferase
MVAESEILALKALGHQIFIFSMWGQQTDDSRVPIELRDRLFRIEQKLSASLFASIAERFIRLPFRSARFIFEARRYIGAKFSLISLGTARILQSLGIERIHAHFASTNAIRGMVLADFLKVPFSCTGHGSDILLYPLPCLAEIIQRADPFITISDYNKNHLVKVYGSVAQKAEVIRCGVDLSKFKPNEGKNRKIPNILSVTWLRQAKGVNYLIEALGILRNQNMNFKCVIVGGGYLSGEIESLIREKGLIPCAELKGPLPHEEVIALYRCADMFVLPSLSEGISISLMEAMAMKLPVVATRITGLSELIIDGENGFLVEPRDPVGIADRIKRLLRDPGLGCKMGAEGRRKVAQDFNLQKNVTILEEIFQNPT